MPCTKPGGFQEIPPNVKVSPACVLHRAGEGLGIGSAVAHAGCERGRAREYGLLSELAVF